MKRRTAIIVAATAAAGTGLTIGVAAGLSSPGRQDSSQFYSGSQPWPFPTAFTAAVPCTVNGRLGQCATVNGVAVILTPGGYQPLTGAVADQVVEETGREELVQEAQQAPVDGK